MLKGYKSTTISKKLREEGLQATPGGIIKFLKHYKDFKTIGRKPGSGRPTKFDSEMLDLVENQMQADDETTATQLRQILKNRGFTVSLTTISRHRSMLDWTFRGSSYYQSS